MHPFEVKVRAMLDAMVPDEQNRKNLRAFIFKSIDEAHAIGAMQMMKELEDQCDCEDCIARRNGVNNDRTN